MRNEINIKNFDGQLVVTSREVAEDFSKRHDHILRNLETLMRNDITQNWGKYFIEDSYKDNSGKNNKEYLLTRDGFSLLVMGFTGAKAIEWKIKYIEAFNKMEKGLTVMPKMSKELQAIFMLDEKTIEIGNRVSKLENTMTIDYGQQEMLNELAKKVIVEILGGKDAPAYKELAKKVFSQFWKEYKRVLNVNSYKNTAVKDYDLAKKIIKEWKPTRELDFMIKGCNSQVRMY